jgi:hypothetical protein
VRRLVVEQWQPRSPWLFLLGHFSSTKSNKHSSSSGRGSSSSNTGGSTKTGSGVTPNYGGGRYYGGGATSPYRSGARSPLGIVGIPLAVGALAFYPGIWLYGAYAYPYGHVSLILILKYYNFDILGSHTPSIIAPPEPTAQTPPQRLPGISPC